MEYHEIAIIVPPVEMQGYGFNSVRVLAGMKMQQHTFVYDLYLENPSLPMVILRS